MSVSTRTGRPGPHPVDAGPDSPTDLRRGSWGATLKRTWKEFREDSVTDWAAALTYYAVLSIFPALLVLVSLLGVAGESATDEVLANLTTVAPGPGRDIATSAVENLQSGGAGIALVVGLLGALWSASGYVSAFSRASNSIWEVEEGRPFYVLRPQQLLLTAVLLVLLAASALAVVATGGIAEQAGTLLGVSDSAVAVWDVAKWPVLILVVSLMLAVLYWAAPNAQQAGFRWISPGSIVAVVLWIIASGLFALYLANFASYNETYGSLGGVIAFLVWLWVTNVAVLFGAEFNAELTRARQIAAGQSPETEPITPPRRAPDEG